MFFNPSIILHFILMAVKQRSTFQLQNTQPWASNGVKNCSGTTNGILTCLISPIMVQLRRPSLWGGVTEGSLGRGMQLSDSLRAARSSYLLEILWALSAEIPCRVDRVRCKCRSTRAMRCCQLLCGFTHMCLNVWYALQQQECNCVFQIFVQ